MAKTKGDNVPASDLGLTEKTSITTAKSDPMEKCPQSKGSEKASKNGKSFTIR